MTDTVKPVVGLEQPQVTSILSMAAIKTPGFVYGAGGAMLVLSICIIAVLKIGGLDGVLVRIGNAYGSQIEESTKKMDHSATRLLDVVERVGKLGASVDAYTDKIREASTRLERIEGVGAELSRRMTETELRVGRLERRPAHIVYRPLVKTPTQ